MTVIIRDPNTSDQLTVDTSKAARASLYNYAGEPLLWLPSYRACVDSTITSAVGGANKSFFVLYGSGTKTIKVTRLVLSGVTEAVVAYNNFVLRKMSSQPSGGTSTDLTKVPLDSSFGASTAALCKFYTIAGAIVDGTLVGEIDAIRILEEDEDTPAAAGIPREVPMEFVYAFDTAMAVLRGVDEGISLIYTQGNGHTLSLEVEWVEY